MNYVYVQQNSTLGASIPYPSPAHPSATVATSGCGVCASLMALMNLTTYRVSLRNWTKALRAAGCRANEGTDMDAVCVFMQKKYGIRFAKTDNINKLTSWLKQGYGAIANVGARGYFSSAGHFVYVAGITKKNKLIVLDPYYYSDKWESTVNGIDRSKYFTYNKKDHTLLCAADVLARDRAGWYYLLQPTKHVKKQTAVFTNGTYRLLRRLPVRTGPGITYPQRKVKELTADAKKHATSNKENAPAVLKAGTKVDAIVKKSGKEYWLKIPSGYVCLQRNHKTYAKRD